LDFHARLYEVKKDKNNIIMEVLRLVELADKADKQVKTFSGGMKRRLEIARGLIHKPRVLFLDEPTTGLDPQTRRKIWNYVKDLRDRHKMTIILTTHYLEEADFLCDRIAIMDKGKIIRTDTPAALKAIVSDKKENPTLEDAFIHLTGDNIVDEQGDPMAEFAKRFRGKSR
ncbi:MAG: ABC transporter ATP-binding protein, partial [Candidatus Micrarchaeaceae archaeon]